MNHLFVPINVTQCLQHGERLHVKTVWKATQTHGCVLYLLASTSMNLKSNSEAASVGLKIPMKLRCVEFCFVLFFFYPLAFSFGVFRNKHNWCWSRSRVLELLPPRKEQQGSSAVPTSLLCGHTELRTVLLQSHSMHNSLPLQGNQLQWLAW